MGKNNQSKYYYCARCQRAVYVPNFRIRKVHLGNDPHGQTKWEFTCWGAVPLRWWRRHRQQVDSPLPPDDPMVRAAKVFTMGMTPDDPQFAEVIQARALAREAAAATDESADPPEPPAQTARTEAAAPLLHRIRSRRSPGSPSKTVQSDKVPPGPGSWVWSFRPMIPAHVWSMTLRIRRHDNADAIVELIAGHPGSIGADDPRLLWRHKPAGKKK
jgi:hypothetical protein